MDAWYSTHKQSERMNIKNTNAKEKLHAYIKGISEKYCVLYSAMSLNIRYYIPLPKNRKRDSL